MIENFGNGWVNRGPRRVTDYDDRLENVGKHWSYADDDEDEVA